jgi:phosphatidylglycerophosphatase A
VLLWIAGWFFTAFLHEHFFFPPVFEGETVWLLYCFAVLLLVVIATIVGLPAATRVALESGREDPGHVVIDEVAGQWLTLAVCRPDWPHALLALALFRLFDITKPWPIRKLETLPGGWGIMLDDLAAGLFGLIALLVIQHWW